MYFTRLVADLVHDSIITLNGMLNYRIVASTNTCYYSENQIFLIFKVSNSNMPLFFLSKKLFCLSLDFLEIPATWQTHDVFVK